MSKTTISAIVCTHNRYNVLGECIDALLRQDIEASRYEIIVVDNSPDKARSDEWRSKYEREPRVKYLYEPIPGLSRARNIGSREAAHSIIAYIDDDAIANPQWAMSIVDAFDYFGPDTAVVGGRIIAGWPNARPEWLDDRMLPAIAVIDWGGDLRIAEKNEWLAGANISFRKNILEQLGGFPEAKGRVGSILISNEEIKMLNEIRALGKHIIYSPKTVVKHMIDPKRLSQSWFRERYAWQAVSDFFMDQSKTAAYGLHALKDVNRFLSHLPVQFRNIRGLTVDLDDPSLTFMQIEATYSMTVHLLSGGKNDKFGENA